MLNDLTPKQIVKELDRFIIGQEDAKKSVAIALRNRWRHQQLNGDIKDEIYPKNLLMIGPTGVGKTEISRRLSKLAKAPFIKVEATKFTEVGYVGRDVEQIVRDLVENAISLVKEEMSKSVYEKAKSEAENVVLKHIAGDDAREATKDTFRKKLRSGLLDEKEIEIEVSEKSNPLPLLDIPGSSGGSMGVMNITDILGKNFGSLKKKKKLKLKKAIKYLLSKKWKSF